MIDVKCQPVSPAGSSHCPENVPDRRQRTSSRRTGTIGSGSASAIATCSIAAASHAAHQSSVADCITTPTSSGMGGAEAAAEHAVDFAHSELKAGDGITHWASLLQRGLQAHYQHRESDHATS
jgi:hypothetical protein